MNPLTVPNMPAHDTPQLPAHTDYTLSAFAALLPMTAWAARLVHDHMPPELGGVWAYSALGGFAVGLLYWHSFRGLGFIPYAITGAAVSGIWAAVAGRWCEGTVGVAMALLGLTWARVLVFAAWFVLRHPVQIIAIGVLTYCFAVPVLVKGNTDTYALVVSLLAAFSWYAFFRPCFELTCEPVMWWMYHIRTAGPGFKEMPPTGPCIILANHASWLDPLFLVKVVPRRITGMMTARFHETPGLGWLARRFNVIRVPESALKQQDTPEIRDTVAALDRGECVVIFPEGYLRRSEEKPLKRFGRGVWQILCERPDTPLYCLWIEGSWGSYCSHWNGPPAKNKKPDRRHPIRIGVSSAVTVPADVLENHMRTRVYLMNLVLGARTHLGLEALPAVELPTKDEDEPTPPSGGADS